MKKDDAATLAKAINGLLAEMTRLRIAVDRLSAQAPQPRPRDEEFSRRKRPKNLASKYPNVPPEHLRDFENPCSMSEYEQRLLNQMAHDEFFQMQGCAIIG